MFLGFALFIILLLPGYSEFDFLYNCYWFYVLQGVKASQSWCLCSFYPISLLLHLLILPCPSFFFLLGLTLKNNNAQVMSYIEVAPFVRIVLSPMVLTTCLELSIISLFSKDVATFLFLYVFFPYLHYSGCQAILRNSDIATSMLGCWPQRGTTFCHRKQTSKVYIATHTAPPPTTHTPSIRLPWTLQLPPHTTSYLGIIFSNTTF